MQYSFAAVLALAATVIAHSNDTIVYTTEVVSEVVTVCPASATITFNGHTYTNTHTESSTITITNCPCTVSKPVYTSTSVVVPTAAPVYPNATVAVPTSAPVKPTTVGTVTPPAKTSTPANLPASGANKAFAMSGASLAGLLGLVAYLL